jgi:hypothetical protein
MRKIFTLLFLTAIITRLSAQTGNIIFFSEEGFPFKIVMNGVIQNEKFQTNVKIPNLNEGPYKIKVLFEDQVLGSIDDKVYMQPGFEQTYTIKKVKISDSEKNLKAFGQNSKDFFKSKDEADANIAKVKAKEERWSIKKLSQNPIMQAAPQTQVAPQAQPVNRGGNYQTNGNYTQQTTTKTTSTPNNSTNMNVGMNIDGMSMGMNLNVVDNTADVQQSTSHTTTTHTTTQTTNINPPVGTGLNLNVNIGGAAVNSHTTTTTTTTSGAVPVQQQPTYVLPGYSGPYGCPYPMSPQEFGQAKGSIASKSFEDSKMTIAKQICTRKCLLTSQVKEIMLLFTFENNRLDFAKFAYAYTFDTGNYYLVNDAFTFETSIDELNAYISR